MRLRSSFAAVLTILVAAACDTETPTTAVVVNSYPAAPDDAPTMQTVVYKVWWATTLFTAPVPGGQSTDPQRTVPVVDYAYALLAPGWDPTSSTPPTSLIPVRTNVQLAPKRGDTLQIVISDHTVSGNCVGGSPLTQDDADFITQRIFPGEFADVTYDAATCSATPLAAGSGGAAGAAGGTDAGGAAGGAI